MDKIFGAVLALLVALLALLVAVPAAAADDPETVYGKLHRATLAGSVEEVLSYATADKRKEMASLSGKEDVVRMMALSLPKAYSVTKKDTSADGRKAHLELRGVHDARGRRDHRDGRHRAGRRADAAQGDRRDRALRDQAGDVGRRPAPLRRHAP